MSIFGALRSGVSGLFVQSQALATTADNIANVNTTGYKVNRVQFSTLVTNSASPTLFSSGGVQSRVARDNDVQGLLAASSSATDIAVVGQGFFTVTGRGDVQHGERPVRTLGTGLLHPVRRIPTGSGRQPCECGRLLPDRLGAKRHRHRV